MKRVVITDNTKDIKGDIILAQGVILERYEKHPVLLYMHNADMMPIGTLKEIRIENNAITAEPAFDMQDFLAVECRRKYELGLLAVSVGIKPLVVEQGAGVRIIKSCELCEVSLVTLPANPNALIIKSAQADVVHYLETKTYSPMLEILRKELGLEPTADEQTAMLMVKKMQSDLLQAKQKVQELEAKSLAEQKAKAEHQAADLYEKAFAAGKITATQKDFIVKAALADYEGTKKYVDTLPVLNKSLLAQLGEGKLTGLEKKLSERKDWTFTDWQKKDSTGLSELKKTMPEAYKDLLDTLKTR